jgi:hypothetical protein
MDWANSRNVKFAVGCTALILIVRWLLTGDLLLMSAAFASEPAEGETKSASILAVVWPVFFEAMVIVGGSLIAFSLGLWDRLQALLTGGTTKTQAVTGDAVQDLARAVALGDAEAETAARAKVRKPYALGELSQALDAGDFELVEAKVAELKRLAGK